MDPGLAAALERGVELFNQERFFEAHDVWEDRWRLEGGEARTILHGLIQIAAAFVKLQAGQPRGTVALLDKGAARLAPFSPGRLGLDLQALLASVARWRETALRMIDEGTTDFDRAALPRLTPGRL